MSSILVKVNNRYVYFFANYESAKEEADLFDNYEIYKYADKEYYVIGDANATELKRPHFHDWNGALYPHQRLDSDTMIQWRTDFISQLSLVKNLQLMAA